MADLAASDITITINKSRVIGNQHVKDVTLAFGDGALEYPTTGIPAPSAANMGMHRNLDRVDIYENTSAEGFNFFWDATNSVIKIMGKVTVKGPLAATSLKCTAYGW